jgi:hypothetical protein
VATILLPINCDLAIDGVAVRERSGVVNPALRLSQNDGNTDAFIVDMLPGSHTLALTCSRHDLHSKGLSWALAYYAPLMDIGNDKTLEITHTFRAGEISIIGMQGSNWGYNEVAVFPVDAADRDAIIETRNNAKF